METASTRSTMTREIQALAREGQVACAALLQLAVQLEVAPLVLGKLAGELGLKIAGCQLGCFR